MKVSECKSILPDLSKPVVMAILNATPDSFYEASRLAGAKEIGHAAVRAAEEGAAILDVGGYSTRPGAAEVGAEEEYSRVARAVEAVRRRLPEMPVSVDTFRADVVRRIAEEFGPVIVNDISGGELDPDMIPTAAELGLPFIAMHMRGTPATMQQHIDYDDVTKAVEGFFEMKLAQLLAQGVEQVVIDPGFGFAKTTEQNYELLGRLGELKKFGYPILAGVSRKSMIYKVLGGGPEDALPGTVALGWECLRAGASILRVHDVREAVDTVRLYNYYTENNGGKEK